jgi:uncharacterized protein
LDILLDPGFDANVPYAEILVVGVGVGVVFGIFGAGGSAFATPLLALLGVPGVVAVASPLPAMLPASAAAARRYLRSEEVDRSVLIYAVAGGVPGAIVGALASSLVTGPGLLVLSGVMLAVVGARVLAPDPVGHADRCAARRARPTIVLGAAFAVGLITGLLANGGGFLLVPVFVLLLGLTTGQAAGTSMVAVGALTIPTLMTHWYLGHIDWRIAVVFAVGVLPGSLLGARAATRIAPRIARQAFGVLLVIFAALFLVLQLA